MATAKRHMTIFISIFFLFTSCGQEKNGNYLLAFTDRSSGKELWGFKATEGQVIIQPKYEAIGTDTMYDIAFVTLNFKWVVINRRSEVILTPYMFDNGPDHVQEGLFRYTENNKIGFANMLGEKIIKAKFDYASTFNSGLAAFNVGGQLKKMDEEHSSWSGGLWGFIDRFGNIVIEPKFSSVYDFMGEHSEAWTQDDKHILIDKKGRTVKVITE